MQYSLACTVHSEHLAQKLGAELTQEGINHTLNNRTIESDGLSPLLAGIALDVLQNDRTEKPYGNFSITPTDEYSY